MYLLAQGISPGSSMMLIQLSHQRKTALHPDQIYSSGCEEFSDGTKTFWSGADSQRGFPALPTPEKWAKRVKGISTDLFLCVQREGKSGEV